MIEEKLTDYELTLFYESILSKLSTEECHKLFLMLCELLDRRRSMPAEKPNSKALKVATKKHSVPVGLTLGKLVDYIDEVAEQTDGDWKNIPVVVSNDEEVNGAHKAFEAALNGGNFLIS